MLSFKGQWLLALWTQQFRSYQVAVAIRNFVDKSPRHVRTRKRVARHSLGLLNPDVDLAIFGINVGGRKYFSYKNGQAPLSSWISF
jgi:hypothetical protein